MEPRIPSLLIDPALLDARVNDNRIAHIGPRVPSGRPLPIEPAYRAETTHIDPGAGKSSQEHGRGLHTGTERAGDRALESIILKPSRARVGSARGAVAYQSEAVTSASPRSKSQLRAKHGGTLAEVLNDSEGYDRRSRARGNSLSDILIDGPRKRKRVEHVGPGPPTSVLGSALQDNVASGSNSTTLLPLPKPQPHHKKKSTRRLPPLLQGLHQPPPDAGLFPRITEKEIEVQQPTAQSVRLADEDSAPSVTPQEKKASADQEKESRNKDAAGAKQPTAGKAKRNKWTESETTCLLKGVARFGIGSWKQILACEDYTFVDRSAIDLKDRFRTCRPGDYKARKVEKHDAKDRVSRPTASTKEKQPQRNEDPAVPTVKARKPRAGTHRKGADELARIGIEEPFAKSTRRERRPFTDEEDEALLKGYDVHGTQWHLIRKDASLQLEHRQPTDLRDRFRNKYPDRLGKTKARKDASSNLADDPKQGPQPSQDNVTSDAAADPGHRASDQQERSLTLATGPLRQPQNGPPFLNPIDTTFSANFFPSTYADIDSGDDHSPVTLSSNIFRWVDANKPSNVMNLLTPSNTTGDPTSAPATLPSSHISNGITLSMLISGDNTGSEQNTNLALPISRQNLNPMLPNLANVSLPSLLINRGNNLNLPPPSDLLQLPSAAVELESRGDMQLSTLLLDDPPE